MASPPRVHVVGSSPRSGTTLMFELLVSCFALDKFGDHEVSLFRRPDNAARPYVSKNPTDFVRVCRVLRWDPKLHVIYMQRDPRDVIVSQHGSQPGQYWCDFNVWRRNQTLLPRLAGHPRLHICRYEDLVQDPDHAQDLLQARFAFLRRTAAFSRFEDVAQSSEAARLALKGVRRISATSVGKWREHLPRVAAQLQAFPDLPDFLTAVGYEQDRSWLGALRGIASDQSESVRGASDRLRRHSRPVRATLKFARRIGTLREEIGYILRRS